jgi:hypothetical protein
VLLRRGRALTLGVDVDVLGVRGTVEQTVDLDLHLSAAFADAGAIMAIPSAHPDAPTTANNFLIIEDPF